MTCDCPDAWKNAYHDLGVHAPTQTPGASVEEAPDALGHTSRIRTALGWLFLAGFVPLAAVAFLAAGWARIGG